MSTLIQQLLETFNGIGEENQESNSRRRRQVPIEKGQSFKEKKGGIQWRGWQMPRLVDPSSGYEPSKDGHLETAVAASAYAIKMLREPRTISHKRSGEAMESVFRSGRRREEDMTSSPQLGGVSRRLSRNASKEDAKSTGEAAARKSEIMADGPKPLRIPTLGKTPTFTEKRKVPSGNGTVRTTLRPAASVAQKVPNKLETDNKKMKATAWEIAKLAAIQRRYEESVNAIDSWEKKRQRKAESRLKSNQEELDRELARAATEYKDQMNKANKIAGGARSQAEENRRNEEMKAKEKAQRIRLTGEVPATCFCF